MQISKWRRGGIRPPQNFIFEIRLVRYLGHPFAKLWVLGRPTAPYNTILRKNVPCKNGLLTNKMCSFSVWNHKMFTEQSSIFVNVFRYDRCIWKMSNNFIWVLVSFPRHKNIIPRCVHIRAVQHTVMKTPTWTKMRILVGSETHIPWWQQIAHNSSIMYFWPKNPTS